MSPEQQQVSPSAEGDLGPGERGASLERVLACLQERAVLANGVVTFKFGGSSLKGAERLRHSAALVREAAQSSAVTVVVSAMKGVTDRLLNVAHLLAEGRNVPARREAEAIVELHLATVRELQLERIQHDRLVQELKLLSADLLHEIPHQNKAIVTPALFDRLGSFGERFAARLFAAALVASTVPAVPVASSDFVVTCDTFRDAKPHLEHTRRRGRQVLLPLLEAGIVPVVTGFIGATQDGRITHPRVLPLAAQTGMTVWVRNTFKPQVRGTRIASQAKGGAA